MVFEKYCFQSRSIWPLTSTFDKYCFQSLTVWNMTSTSGFWKVICCKMAIADYIFQCELLEWLDAFWRMSNNCNTMMFCDFNWFRLQWKKLICFIIKCHHSTNPRVKPDQIVTMVSSPFACHRISCVIYMHSDVET